MGLCTDFARKRKKSAEFLGQLAIALHTDEVEWLATVDDRGKKNWRASENEVAIGGFAAANLDRALLETGDKMLVPEIEADPARTSSATRGWS